MAISGDQEISVSKHRQTLSSKRSIESVFPLAPFSAIEEELHPLEAFKLLQTSQPYEILFYVEHS
eukprot:765761-Hanusia_phi.AAC.8